MIRVYAFYRDPREIPKELEGATNVDRSGAEFPFPEKEVLRRKRVVACTLATAAKVRWWRESSLD